MARNIRSLSLAPLVAADPRAPPSCAHSTAQLPAAMPSSCPPRSPVLLQQTSTVFLRGLITPTTPCYVPPDAVSSSSSSSSNTSSSNSITSSNTSSIKTSNRNTGNSSSSSIAIQTARILQRSRSVAMPVLPMDGDPTPESPTDAPANDAGDDTDCDCIFSFEDFEKRYVPLSHLPTPPHSHACAAIDSRAPQGPVDTEFWAKYLVSMIPRNASRQSPSTAVLAGILQRADLRLGVVSLACCVLDCLSDRFLRQWRRLCLGRDGCPERSELLAICALAVSMKFMEDSAYPAKTWTRAICENLFSVQALNLTERLVLADLNYCLLGISTPQLLDRNLAEIRRCTQDAAASLSGAAASGLAAASADTETDGSGEGGFLFAKSAGTAFPLSEY